MEEQITKHINEEPDSMELGTPAKGGALKIYGNYDKPEEFRKKIEEAISMRKWANSLLEQ